MNSNQKVYVIDPTASASQENGSGKMGSERTLYSPDNEGPQSPQKRRRRVKGPFEEQGSALLTFFSYLAGPYTILTTRHGRESRFWVVLAILSSTLATIVLARASKIFAAPQGTGIGFIIWLSLASLAAGLGFATWAHAAFLLGRHKGHLLKKLPDYLRNPGSVWILGLVMPGLGLHACEHPRRAAAVMLTICAMVVSVIVLWQAPDLWQLSRTGILVGYGDILERVLMVLGAVALVGAFAWIIQAFDGARLAGLRKEYAAEPHGDWAVVALVLAIAALLVTFKPARVAETVDRFAVSMREDGMRVIPLYAARAAMRMDPSQPQYAVRAIEINEALGRKGAALALRQDLEERWMPYARMQRLERWVIDNAVLRPEQP